MEESSPPKENVLIIELNEFNTDLLTAAVKAHSLPNISKLLNKHRAHYKTNDRYNSGYLEPWVQWVSIHTGTQSQKHKIKHLGDLPDLQCAQSWEILSDHNITTGIWGVMNGARRNKENVQFFLPDPWTFSENAYPKDLNNLLDLPRYVSKNYRSLKISTLFSQALKLFHFIFTSGQGTKIFASCLSLLGSLLKRGKKPYIFISFFDYVSTLLFIKYKRRFNPRCSILFLNSLAHIQHHHWKEGADGITAEILHGLQTIDKILALITEHFPNDEIIVHNGLSQMNTNHEKPWVLYRQKDPLAFLKAMRLKPVAVEQHMTHDGHAFFATKEDCQNAYNFLASLKIENKNLFHVEKNSQDETKLFYQLNFTDDLSDKQVLFKNQYNAYAFFKYFDKIVTRTGRHIPIGTVFSDKIKFPDHMFNHEFNKYVHHFLSPEKFSLKVEIPQSETSLNVVSEELCIPSS
ncbi:hypothetical protein CC99x_001615 [Candidatus Berkiella cookevillensis]|uniref:Uncharacterized protein n=1 Tax=Candidatus Berkiella cookevillensis TaxID=437022 RepID=A0A0Q9YRZ4_9GAMM|nr:hypothetical protein [Candidatus Berkiella cookevillensis]MCS5707595.1 hypothetical protein [Candidatus Berkiella cookevillensis]